MILEVGKIYTSIRKLRLGGEIRTLSKIIGSVNRETLEFKEGYAVYTDRGNCVFRDTDYTPPSHPKRNVVIEVTSPEEIKNRYQHIRRVNGVMLLNQEKYIASSHRNFVMRLGGIYVDRTMLEFMITEWSQKEDSNDDIFCSNRSTYSAKGLRIREDTSIPSMHDILYMRKE